MKLSTNDVRNVAQLARLQFSDDELPELANQLNEIVAYVEQLGRIDTSNVEPLAHPLPVQNVFRDDRPGNSLPVHEALGNAPDAQGDFFTVPAVFD